MGIYSIKKFGLTSSRGRDRVGVGIRSSYIRVLGIQVDTDGSGELALGPRLCCILDRAPAISPRGDGWASCCPCLHPSQWPPRASVIWHSSSSDAPSPHSLDCKHRPTPDGESWGVSPQAYAIQALRSFPAGVTDWAGQGRPHTAFTFLTQAAALPGP